MNLLDVLTEEDKTKITNYVSFYGGANGQFIGADNWLKDWAANNQKLYKLLGNNLILKIPYSYTKSKESEKMDITYLLNCKNGLIVREKFDKACDDLCRERKLINRDEYYNLCDILTTRVLIHDRVCGNNLSLKVNNKSFRLQTDMKPIRALGKFFKWYEQITGCENYCPEFEDFRIAHSMIFNGNVKQTNIVLSIHPMDFITMSDNANNWSSCMNWQESGCYHLGTVEMMNSNVVICAYLESTIPFVYKVEIKPIVTGDDVCYKTTKEDEWNSKRWRQLFYINKDIILSGKQYPLINNDLTKSILAEIKKLAKENLNWNYSFGPELYGDMKGVNSIKAMSRVRKITRKEKNSIWIDTKAMYNDMLNDSNTDYYCYRNKPKKGYILSVSGKAPCVCCGGDAAGEENQWDGYNDRYQSGVTVCNKCLDDIRCVCCLEDGPWYGNLNFVKIEDKSGETYRICPRHLFTKLQLCACCNRPISKLGFRKIVYGAKDPATAEFTRTKIDKVYDLMDAQEIYDKYMANEYVPIFLCDDCLTERNWQFEFEDFTSKYYWADRAKKLTTPLELTEEEVKKMCCKAAVTLPEEYLDKTYIKIHTDFKL